MNLCLPSSSGPAAESGAIISVEWLASPHQSCLCQLFVFPPNSGAPLLICIFLLALDVVCLTFTWLFFLCFFFLFLLGPFLCIFFFLSYLSSGCNLFAFDFTFSYHKRQDKRKTKVKEKSAPRCSVNVFLCLFCCLSISTLLMFSLPFPLCFGCGLFDFSLD